MEWPFVSRSRYAEVVADRDWYREQFVRVVGPKEPKKPFLTGEAAKPDDLIVKEAEDAFVQRLQQDFIAAGAHPAVAKAEADRIRREAGIAHIGG